MPAHNDRAVTTPFLFQWIEADLALLETFHAGTAINAADRDFFEKEVPLALENAKACLSELKSRMDSADLTAEVHPAGAPAQPLQTQR